MPRFRELYIFLLLASFAFFAFDAGYLAFWCFLTFSGVLAFSVVYLQLYAGKLKPAFSNKPPSTMEGDGSYILFSLTNTSRYNIRLAQLHIRLSNIYTGGETTEVVEVSVPARQTIDIRLVFTSRYCGIIKAEIARIVYYDILFCFRRDKLRSKDSVAPSPITIFVAPRLYPIGIEAIPDPSVFGDAPAYSKTKGGNEPPDVFDYREFKVGDSVKWISSKLSAKRNELIVKQYSLSQPACPVILCDISCEASPDVLQLVAQAAASFAAYYASGENGCRLMRYRHFDNSIAGSYVFNLNDIENELSAFFAEEDNSGFDIDIIKAANELSPTMLIYITNIMRAETFAALAKLHIPHLELYATDYEAPDHSTSASNDTFRRITPQNIAAVLEGGTYE